MMKRKWFTVKEPSKWTYVTNAGVFIAAFAGGRNDPDVLTAAVQTAIIAFGVWAVLNIIEILCALAFDREERAQWDKDQEDQVNERNRK
jgi:hypothetical protein